MFIAAAHFELEVKSAILKDGKWRAHQIEIGTSASGVSFLAAERRDAPIAVKADITPNVRSCALGTQQRTVKIVQQASRLLAPNA